MQQHGFRTKFLRDAYAEGEAKGRAEGLRTVRLHLLDRRGVTVPREARARIDSEAERATLERWLDAAVTADGIAEVFGDN